ncbi:MAG: flagellar assembly protein FliW [Deltaproteobacteria bacterium]|nr:flagellar assembly protein FliW [Deltaproteobacteria bacterium]
MMQIKTTRFGEIELDEDRLLRFPEGMIGFPDMKNYVLLEHKPGSPFMWLQSTESPDLAFVLINPHLIQGDYLERIPSKERSQLAGENGRDPLLFAVVTIPPGEPQKMTVNLLGPVVIDVPARTGRQIILADSGFNTRHAAVRD